ncbi:MAG: radical SAM protein [Clostridia bacterium]|nr:radical SAM protein [Clostridia bacterium]
MSEKRTLYGTVIVTYRCNARCNMCDCFKDPSRPADEITLDTIKKLPEMAFTNITGGEPFVRQDIPEIVGELYKKSDRIVISTNGFFTDRIISLCKQYPRVGIRISIEGLQETNDKIRGIPDGFRRGYETLKTLVDMKHPDVGFGMTVQDMNCTDLIPLYELANELNMEFATATLHNSFYFRKTDNRIEDKRKVGENFEKLINTLLKSKSPKKWFRAYFNYGLINYMYGNPRLLPCEMGNDAFFIDPFGDVLPCNGMAKKMSMGNLNEMEWNELWNGEQARAVREHVKHCDRNCWMIGSVSPAMHKRIWVPAMWVMRHKLTGFRFREEDFLKKKA